MNDFLQNNSRKMWRGTEEGRLDPDNSLLGPDVGNMGSTIHFFAFEMFRMEIFKEMWTSN